MAVTELSDTADHESIATKLLNTMTLAHIHESVSAFCQQFASRTGELGQVQCKATEEVTGRGVSLRARPPPAVKPPRVDCPFSAFVFRRRAVYSW